VKPDDGAGCEDTAVAPHRDAARSLLAANPRRMVAQPWIDGEPASLSVLCASGRSTLLAVNRQEVRIVEQSVMVNRLVVNAITDIDGRLAALAEAVVRAIPGLWGYIGIDLVRTPDGPVVLEVNPRLTTSYCGLEAALGLNVAELVLKLTAPDPSRERGTPNRGRSVEIALAPSL
jgi:predicted ATP-grasp superfamily ATP-dependent carboligase